MKIEIYQEACKRTKNDLGSMLNAVHMALGLGSELGEVYECLCKSDVQDELDKVNLGEEIGDHSWYICNYASDRGYKLNDTVFETPLENTPYDTIIINGGKIQDYAKRWLAYGQAIDDNKKVGEEWKVISEYISSLHTICVINDIDFETVLGKNITKLYKRYPEKFSTDSALVRNLEEELKVLS